ncbi:MAG: AmmeMemoRadiSam system radical SAM enzyme [Methanotrichaceae archaeon]|nr:AmmeMemoRadiSam system radical SAM enzyme [Methanotrichaceae archaeon]
MDDNDDVNCILCHQFCRIKTAKKGLCGVRENRRGQLMTLVYGNLVAANIDPIEKKPLYHFLPGSLAYSIATEGCNFRCLHCQNADVSQGPKETGRIRGGFVPPENVVNEALENGCQSIAYTYTEPTMFFEYAYDVALLAKEKGLKNLFVSNGYTGEEAVQKIIPILDGNNIDLKGDDQFYRKVCGARIEPVKHNIELMWDKGIWIEVTTLIIPGYNDSDGQLRELAEFIAGVSADMPWHLSAFYPTYKMTDAPPTGIEALRKGVRIGQEAGLKYIYAGNMPNEYEDTKCPDCGEVIIERRTFGIMKNSMLNEHCPKCGSLIPGVWS